MPPDDADDADISQADPTPTMEGDESEAKAKHRWRQSSLKRVKALRKAGLQWAKHKPSASTDQEESGSQPAQDDPPRNPSPPQTLTKATKIWTWVKGDNPLPDPKPPKHKHPRQDIHREDPLWIRDPHDVGAQIWEWIIGENPLAPPKPAAAATKARISSALAKGSRTLVKKDIHPFAQNHTLRTAWVWLKGDNPLSPPKPQRAGKSQKIKIQKMKWLALKRKHKATLAPITECTEALDEEPDTITSPDNDDADVTDEEASIVMPGGFEGKS